MSIITNTATTEAPTVSVVVPFYNTEKYLGECLESLKQQTFEDFEVLCVDDGSTDGSLAIAQACAGDDVRFNFDVLPENRGQSAARNVAMHRARGEYLVFLDSDDYLKPIALEKLVERARAQQLDDLYFQATALYESKKMRELVHEDFSHRPSFNDVATGQELFTFFENHAQFFPHVSLRMVRRDLVQSNGIHFYEGIIHEDVLFVFQTLVASRRSSYLDESLYMRRIRPGSTMTTQRSVANIRGHFVCVQEMNRWLLEHADELSDTFVGAMTHRIVDYRLLAARDWHYSIDEPARIAYMHELLPAERVAFYGDVLQPGAVVERLNKEFYESKTYRLGNAFLSAPRIVRNHIAELLRFRKDR